MRGRRGSHWGQRVPWPIKLRVDDVRPRTQQFCLQWIADRYRGRGYFGQPFVYSKPSSEIERILCQKKLDCSDVSIAVPSKYHVNINLRNNVFTDIFMNGKNSTDGETMRVKLRSFQPIYTNGGTEVLMRKGTLKTGTIYDQ